MTSPEELRDLATSLVALTADRPELAARARRVAERVATQRFHIAVLGEFKRGKSTLVNALIGRPVLPTGAVPLTAVPTEIHMGETATWVVHLDGRRVQVAPEDIGTFVTEASNPSNERGVARVEVGVPEIFGAPGVVFVDTPGVASVHAHNTETAWGALADSDAAVLVLSADSPLSANEELLLTEVAGRRSTVFVVVNKSDHLSASELEEVDAFTTAHIRRILGQPIRPFFVSARAALDAAAGAAGAGDQHAGSFHALRDALEQFIRDDLAGARQASALRELTRLAQRLDDIAQIEEAGSAMTLEQLHEQMGLLAAAADDGGRRLEEDTAVLQHEVRGLIDLLAADLAAAAARAAARSLPRLRDAAAGLASRHLDSTLRQVIEACVREELEPVRREVADTVEQRWEAIAARYARRVQSRVDELTAAVNELFHLHLPVAPVPEVTAIRERFSYAFLHVEGPQAVIGHAIVAILPPALVRRRAIRTAERRMVQAMDQHAGRARYDLTSRLQESSAHFAAAMAREYDSTRASMLDAVDRARTELARTGVELEERGRRRGEVRALLARIDQAPSSGTPSRTAP